MNKEIEELLTKLKTVLKTYKELKIEPTLCEELITTGELNLLLSYIEQLEKENDRLIAESTHYESKYYNEAKKVDKAIEILESMPINANGGEILEVERKVLHILKGDSDE